MPGRPPDCLRTVMSSDTIRYWHRAKKTVETEKIYGERWLPVGL